MGRRRRVCNVGVGGNGCGRWVLGVEEEGTGESRVTRGKEGLSLLLFPLYGAVFELVGC